MIKIQIDQYDMVLSTEKHLQVNETLFSTNASLVASTGLLSSKITALKVQIAKQLVNPKGITIEKRNMRKALEEIAFTIGSACCAYASASTLVNLYNRCHYTKSDLIHFRDAELVGICVNLYEDVIANTTVLLGYNITALIITDFQTAIANFSEATPNPKEAIGKRTSATAQIAILLPEILDMMRTRLDNDIVSMAASEPDFVGTYYNVRTLRKSPVITRSLVITTIDETTQAPISDDCLEIIGKSVRRKSGESGRNRIQNLVSGSHQLQVAHRDYQMQKQSFTITSGETTELLVLMNKKLNSKTGPEMPELHEHD